MSKKREEKKAYKLSIYLLKEDVTDFKKAMKEGVSVVPYEIKKEFKIDGKIYVGITKSNTSDWRDLLQDGTAQKLPPLESSSNRAILFFRLEDRIFALPFGYGKHLLKEDVIERDFGLRTALNVVDADKLRSMDKANLDSLTVLTKTQTSRKSKQEEFNIDIIRDLLRGVTGDISLHKEALGEIITGSEGVYILPKIDFGDIFKNLKLLKKAYESNIYKSRFEWIDNLKAERDPAVITNLVDQLIQDLKAKDTINIHISPPDLIDWNGFEGLSYTPKGELESDFDIDGFYEKYDSDLSDLDRDKLMRVRIYIKSTDDENERSSIPFWRCINYQTEIGDNLFVFAFGKWYRVNKTYAKQIKDYVTQIVESSLVYVDCDKGMNEGDYNIKLSKSNPGFSLMDKQLVGSDIIQSGIEVCDVLSNNGEFIHVKFRKDSATLSHLFAQGKISAALLMKSRVFRKNLRVKLNGLGLKNDFVPLEYKDLKRESYTITYAIIEDKTRSFVDALPFFSLLNFRLTAEELLNWGYKVKVKKILQLKEFQHSTNLQSSFQANQNHIP